MPSSLEKATNFYRVENDVQRHVANACEDIGFDTNLRTPENYDTSFLTQ